jgi:hypothetical protein
VGDMHSRCRSPVAEWMSRLIAFVCLTCQLSPPLHPIPDQTRQAKQRSTTSSLLFAPLPGPPAMRGWMLMIVSSILRVSWSWKLMLALGCMPNTCRHST